MKTFSITTEALNVIKDICKSSSHKSPVAVLADMADPEPFLGGIKEKISCKEAVLKFEEEKLRELMRSLHSEGLLLYSLVVLTYEIEDIDSNELFELNGITFAMKADVRESLSGYLLTYINGKFFFEDSSGAVRSFLLEGN